MKMIVITPPEFVPNEAILCNSLFARGLERLHLRKPEAEITEIEKFILQIEPQYRSRIVLHQHYELATCYRLQGIHLKSGQAHQASLYTHCGSISISCHNLEEIRHLPFSPAYCFLSPLFESISKPGYISTFPEIPDVSSLRVPVIALGGITPEKIPLCMNKGFAGVAVLGYLWKEPGNAIQRYVQLTTPYTMSIAGFDPSSGAGVTADLKTFENTGSYGLGICSALTFQNEDSYTDTRWIPLEEIQKQCQLQFGRHLPAYLKIGLIENFEILDQLTAWLKTAYPTIKIIWDPILKASAGFTFHTEADRQKLNSILSNIYLITPNTEELYALFGQNTTSDTVQAICQQYQVNILWKGGHNAEDTCVDRLYTPTGNFQFALQRSAFPKHGTGCVLSAAITSALAQGLALPEACNRAQIYVSRLMESNNTLLGYHQLGNFPASVKTDFHVLPVQYITAPREGITLAEQVEAICRGGVRWVQLRMKGSSTAEIRQEGLLIREICQRYRALFIVNDNVEAARQLDADGVHLGKEDCDPQTARKILGKGKIIGATCNTWEDILLRSRQQVDYIGLGPYTFTTTKEKLSPVLGLEGYQTLLEQMQATHIDIPVFAIGGIEEKDIPALFQTGIQGIALSGLLRNHPEPEAQTKHIVQVISNSSIL